MASDCLEQLDAGIPANRIRCKVKLAKRQDDSGNKQNHIVTGEIIGIDEPTPERNRFADQLAALWGRATATGRENHDD